MPRSTRFARPFRRAVMVIAVLTASLAEAFAQGLPQTITFHNPGTSRAITTAGLAVSASSGLPVELESLTSTVCTVSNESGGWGVTHHIGGTCTVTARQPGDVIYAPAADVTESWTVTRIPQTIVFDTPIPRYPNQDLPLSGFASPGLRPLTYTSETPAVCPLTFPAQARLERKGTCTITAREPGDAAYEPAADVTVSFQVLAIPQTISFTNPGPQRLGSGIVPLAVASTVTGSQFPGLLVTLTSTTPSVCAISGRDAMLLALGTCTIVASQAGNEDFDPAVDVTQSFSVILGTPDAPTGVVAHVTGNFVSLAWNAAPTGPAPDGYLVEVGDGPGRTTVTSVLTPLLGDTGLLPQGEYYLRVRALNTAGLSDPSDDVWVRVVGTEAVALPPLAPTVVVDGETVSFRWTAATGGAPPESFLVQVRSNPFGGHLAQVSLPANQSTFTVPNVPAGVYVMQVRATTDAGPSPPSPSIWLRVGSPPPCSGAPASPLMLTPVVDDSLVSLSWLPPVDEAASFILHAGTGPGQSDLATLDLGAVGGVGAEVGAGEYFVRVVSAGDCGPSAPSVEQALTIGGATPDAPTGLSATPGSGGVTFTWTPPSGVNATHYVVEAGLAPGTTLMKFPVTGAATVTIPGVPSGTTFVARVRGANASGVGAASPEIVVTVP